MKDKTTKDTKPQDVAIPDVEIAKPEIEDKHIIKLTKHYSPDNDLTYYFIRLDRLNLYSNEDLDKVKERFDYIIKIGLKAYLEEIRIQVTLIKEQVVEK